jgi:type II secretory pathway pseudopilin PulG
MSRHARRAPPATLLLATLLLSTLAHAQAPVLTPEQQAARELQNQATARDHQQMLDQLGITKLRPGPSGDPKSPDSANYDEARANPYPDWPDPLRLDNGKRVTTARIWQQQRRPEIIEDFEREVLGRVPRNLPAVSWSVSPTTESTVGGLPVRITTLTARVDNSTAPDIDVTFPVTLIKPQKQQRLMPTLIMFNFRPPTFPADGPQSASLHTLVAAGWAVALVNPTTIQADNGAGLTRGIIGLANKGDSRHPEDWGALRAWAWGASQVLTQLTHDSEIDARRIGIEGVSRYGKAALVAMAFDERFAMVLIGSSGEGGAKPHRRNFGEAVENLTGSGEYHWMAGNFLKYGAAEARDGARTANDIPVESSGLIALCAPRLTFISYGSPDAGDAPWLDQQGSYMAAVAAGKVFRLLGARDLGVGDDYRNAKKPAIGVSQLDGQLAWRQHEGGHTDGPNVPFFVEWAERNFARRE